MCMGGGSPSMPKLPEPPKTPPLPTPMSKRLDTSKKKKKLGGRRGPQDTASLRIPIGVAKPSSGTGLSIPKSTY